MASTGGPEDAGPRRNEVEIMPLGAGQEVGRSCIILSYAGKRVMLDCGIHPGHRGLASLPYLDSVDLASVDLIAVTHFHLDHCAALPYVLAKTVFKGRVLMTHATRAIYALLLHDFVRVSRGSADEGLYSQRDVEASLDRIELIDFDQTLHLGGITVTAVRAGHVLGAAMFVVEIAGLRTLYTGDYSRVADRHMAPADLPLEDPPHIVIVESTYGVSSHQKRGEREVRLAGRVREVVARGGRVLLPVVAIGRAQELLLILEDYWEENPDLQRIPIYQASSLSDKALSVFRTYLDSMNADIAAAFRESANPFRFRHVRPLGATRDLGSGPCVVLATPSMLQSGVSRELFEMWCEDRRNGVIIADYAVPGTTARDILSRPPTIINRAGHKVPLRCSVEAISFSAHADFPQTRDFLDALAPRHVVLVHGEKSEMMRLRQALEKQGAAMGQKRSVYTPACTQPVLIPWPERYPARVVGSLAGRAQREGAPLRGLLVRPQGGAGPERPLLLAPRDLPSHTRLGTGRIAQRQTLRTQLPLAQIRLALEVLVEGVEGGGAGTSIGPVKGIDPPEGAPKGVKRPPGQEALSVGGHLTLTYTPAEAEGGGVPLGAGGGPPGAKRVKGEGAEVRLEWVGGPPGDLLADAVLATVLEDAGEPAKFAGAEAMRRAALAAGDTAAVQAAERAMLCALLGSQFGPARLDIDQGLAFVQVDEQQLVVDCRTEVVECAEPGLRERAQRAVNRLRCALAPAPLEGGPEGPAVPA